MKSLRDPKTCVKSNAEKYGLKKFEDLQTSTRTVVIRANVDFSNDVLFYGLDLTEVDVPFTKKQKNVDKKKITAPYGAIISVQSKTRIRGVDIRKKKKHWCTICQPFKYIPEKEMEVKVYTITEQLQQITDPDIALSTGNFAGSRVTRELIAKAIQNAPLYDIMYFCSKCQRTYRPEEIKKINHFLNQMTVVVSIGKQPLLNIMFFKDKLKIAGCKAMEDAEEVILLLWQDYICKMKTYGSLVSWKSKKGASKNPRFGFESVMRNVDFKLGFPIERPALNSLMNEERFSHNIFMSQYESSAHTNVNIKMFSRKPKDFKYDVLVIPLDEKKGPYFIQTDEIPYKIIKKKDLAPQYITFIVFSSSEIILSGRFDQNMKEMYEFFVDTIFKNRNRIEEHLESPNDEEIKKVKNDIKTVRKIAK